MLPGLLPKLNERQEKLAVTADMRLGCARQASGSAPAISSLLAASLWQPNTPYVAQCSLTQVISR
jgi:hypothetical protein